MAWLLAWIALSAMPSLPADMPLMAAPHRFALYYEPFTPMANHHSWLASL